MDPLSIATGSAGLISLGLTACNGLITYYQDYQSRDGDLDLIEQHAESLRAIVHGLSQHIYSSLDAITADASRTHLIQQCIDACDVCITDFKILKRKYSRTRRRNLMHQFMYPFQKKKFDDLKAQMQEFRSALSSYILLLNLDLTRGLHQTTLRTSENLTSSILEHGQVLSDKLSTVVPGMMQTLDHSLVRFENSIQERFENLERTLISTVHLNTQSPLPEVATDIATEQSIANELTELSPASLLGFSCCCSSNPVPRNPGQRSFTRLTHEECCPLAYQNLKSHVVIGGFKLFKWLFQFKVAIQYSRIAARDFQIHPNLTVQAIVQSSPAFDTVYETFWKMEGCHTTQELRKVSEDCLKSLHGLFSNGKAWPTDVDQEGRNLLHIAALASCVMHNEEKTAIFSQYLRTMIAMGVPLNEMSLHNKTPLYTIMQQSAFYSLPDSYAAAALADMAEKLMELGAEIGNAENRRLQSPFFNDVYCILPLLERIGPTLDDSFKYTLLIRALLEKSERDVHRLLSSSKSQILERGDRGETPLHIATSWPKGVELLLELGGDVAFSIIDAKDLDGYTPLDYACLLRQPRSARLILDAGAIIDLENMKVIEKTPRHAMNSAQCGEIINIFVGELAKRRKLLLELAMTHLEEKDLAILSIRDISLPQDCAFEIIQLLRGQQVDLPSSFQTVRPGSIYHSPFMSVGLAKALFGAGFDQTNIAFGGFTPLMTVDLRMLTHRRHLESTLDLVMWFEEHGADLFARIPAHYEETNSGNETSAPQFAVIHYIGYVLGEGSYRAHIPESDETRVGQLRRLLSYEIKDPCNCYCSPGGCTPAALFARGMLYSKLRSGEKWPSLKALKDPDFRPIYFEKTLMGGLELLDATINGATYHLIAETILRVATFNRLGMKHTCCRYTYYKADDDEPVQRIRQGNYQLVEIMDSAEIHEIQEEDRDQVVFLESLMKEFSAMLQHKVMPFSKLFYDWWKRMDEIDAEYNEVPRSDIEAIQDIGVVLTQE